MRINPRYYIVLYLLSVWRDDADVVVGERVHVIVEQVLQVPHHLHRLRSIEPRGTIALTQIFSLETSKKEYRAIPEIVVQ